ncbi:H-type small acid-soluble spore protein [Falsibacillus albus]|uniref:Small, acid-soluble spore protein H n=1 Tax=Falsibacillus albus TaxID=2478915 RepID=A0A3L7JX87_9BACI|nr:H-type small acid-soluble spore protein [Falsibacillus albus]RLQ95353.1 H-type small acid-soluble spore protein [Falsibacillus albus]
MDAKRAQEISTSRTIANVICNGNQVYIEHVDQDNGMATIHPLNDANSKQSVSIDSLKEE